MAIRLLRLFAVGLLAVGLLAPPAGSASNVPSSADGATDTADYYGVATPFGDLQGVTQLEFESRTGLLWVVDSANDAVRAHAHNGDVVHSEESSGSGKSQLDNPTDVSLYDRELYVTDGNNDRVQVYNVDGRWMRSWGIAGSDAGEFQAPGGIVVIDFGFPRPLRDLVFVSDTGNNRVQVFDIEGNFVREFGSAGQGDGELSQPKAITYFDGQVLVADTGNERVAVFDARDGSWVRNIDTGPLAGLEIDGSGTLWVAKPVANTVTAYDTSGTDLGSVGTFGDGTDELSSPLAVAFFGTYERAMWILDAGNNRIQSFTSRLCQGHRMTHIIAHVRFYRGILETGPADDVVGFVGHGSNKYEIRLGEGDDVACGDKVFGGKGHDRLQGTGERSQLWGGPGNDVLIGRGRPDRLTGGAGADLLIGGEMGDRLTGNKGADALRGQRGHDVLRGDQGSDTLDGGRATDDCEGGRGVDTLKRCP